jgi:hypothetical protein
VGNNVRIDYRWSAGNEDDTRKYVLELVAFAPDVIFASGSTAVGPLQRATRTVPIVFALVADPVGAGFVDSLARPGGNITGFTSFGYGLGANCGYALANAGHDTRALQAWLGPQEHPAHGALSDGRPRPRRGVLIGKRGPRLKRPRMRLNCASASSGP